MIAFGPAIGGSPRAGPAAGGECSRLENYIARASSDVATARKLSTSSGMVRRRAVWHRPDRRAAGSD